MLAILPVVVIPFPQLESGPAGEQGLGVALTGSSAITSPIQDPLLPSVHVGD